MESNAAATKGWGDAGNAGEARPGGPAAQVNRWRAVELGLAILALTVVHLVVSANTHAEHAIHAVFRGLYLLPIVAGALWFGLRGALLTSAAISSAYAAHVLITWRMQPMENINQLVMIGVFLFVGAAAGMLSEREEQERRRRLEAEQRSQRAAIIQGIAGLSNALGLRDEFTREHSERVAQLTVDIGAHLGLSAERLEILHLAALMHDVGKIGVRDDVLFKPDQLTREERSKIEQHPVLAAKLLLSIAGAEPIAGIVVAHHESPDGSGYPRGLKGTEIPLESRILRVADVFCALTEVRPYKPGMERGQALEWMQRLAGTKLDPASLAGLREVLERSVPPH